MGTATNTMALPPYPRERDPVPTVQESGWAPGTVWTYLHHQGSNPKDPVRSKSLFRLRYTAPPRVVWYIGTNVSKPQISHNLMTPIQSPNPLTFYSLLVTWCTTSLTFNNCTLCPHCICVFCIYLRTNSDLCHLQHKVIGFNVITFIASLLRGTTQENMTSQRERTVGEMT